MIRTCFICRQEKPLLTSFYRTGRYARSYRYSCKDCDRQKAAMRRLPGVLEKTKARHERDKTVMQLVERRLPLHQIADTVGVTKATVKNILMRAR